MSLKIKIEVQGSQVFVATPYNAKFISGARKIGGRFDSASKAWVFDARDESRVRELCCKCYGSDGRVSDLVTLRVEFLNEVCAFQNSIAVHGRPIARATGRDSGASICDGVIVLSGGFRSGGSFKNWTTEAPAGTVVLVRDFPKVAAQELIAQSTDAQVFSIEDETVSKPVDPAALAAERAALIARLTEIDACLSPAA